MWGQLATLCFLSVWATSCNLAIQQAGWQDLRPFTVSSQMQNNTGCCSSWPDSFRCRTTWVAAWPDNREKNIDRVLCWFQEQNKRDVLERKSRQKQIQTKNTDHAACWFRIPSNTGHCPQFNALNDQTTWRRTLTVSCVGFRYRVTWATVHSLTPWLTRWPAEKRWPCTPDWGACQKATSKTASTVWLTFCYSAHMPTN